MDFLSQIFKYKHAKRKFVLSQIFAAQNAYLCVLQQTVLYYIVNDSSPTDPHRLVSFSKTRMATCHGLAWPLTGPVRAKHVAATRQKGLYVVFPWLLAEVKLAAAFTMKT